MCVKAYHGDSGNEHVQPIISNKKEDNHQDISYKCFKTNDFTTWGRTGRTSHNMLACAACRFASSMDVLYRFFLTIPSLKVGEDITTGVNNWP